ncbi:MAG: acyl-[acyl-carrier-protein] thioesterase, partial [Acidimicrobiales bacterium]
PGRGRVFTHARRVHLGDASPAGRLRFDALARFLQDVSNEDTRDSGLEALMSWVVRRTVVDVHRPAVFGELLDLATWCSGTGGRWAERRVAIAGDQGARIETATLWVHVDVDTLRPARLPEAFFALFGEAADGRTVRARLQLPGPTEAEGLVTRRWPLRFVDFDVLDHLNNAAYWVPVEEELARRRDLRAPVRAIVEHVREVERGAELAVAVVDHADSVSLWLQSESGTHAAATVTSNPRQ